MTVKNSGNNEVARAIIFRTGKNPTGLQSAEKKRVIVLTQIIDSHFTNVFYTRSYVKSAVFTPFSSPNRKNSSVTFVRVQSAVFSWASKDRILAYFWRPPFAETRERKSCVFIWSWKSHRFLKILVESTCGVKQLGAFFRIFGDKSSNLCYLIRLSLR